MMKRTVKTLIVIACLIGTAGIFAQSMLLRSGIMTKQKLTLLPVPDDYRNYFLLQSIDNDTTIVLSDFTGAHRLISLIYDENSDGTADNIHDYYPDSKKYKSGKNSLSQFYKKDIVELKKEIISGKLFRDTYSYKMKSLNTLKSIIKKRIDLNVSDDVGSYTVTKDIDGYKVILYESDNINSPSSEFFFAKIRGRYDLVFKTSYYRLFNAKIQPALEYSVYCKNSVDPVVAETVESLLALVKDLKF